MGHSGCKDKEKIQREQEVGGKKCICVKDWFNNLGLHSGDSLVTRTSCKLFYNLDFMFEAIVD